MPHVTHEKTAALGDFPKDPQLTLFRAEISTQEAWLPEPMILPTAPVCPGGRDLLCWLGESSFLITDEQFKCSRKYISFKAFLLPFT